MATTVSRHIKFDFINGAGKTNQYKFNHAQADPNDADVIAAMDAFITNAAVFKNPPTAKKSAELITTEIRDLPISA